MHWKGATTAVSSWQSRSWKSWRGLWKALSDSWCQSTSPSLSSSQAEAQQVHSLLSGSCKRSLAANKSLSMAFLDLEKAFDWENLVWRSGLCKVSIHQGSVLSPLLFIIVLEALSRKFHFWVPWKDLYADDLVIIAESLEECVRRLLTWKEAMEEKGLRLNGGKTKVMICGTGLDLQHSSGEFPCAVCRTGVGSNSIFCNSCKHRVHKKCSGLKCLTKDSDYRCTSCQGTASPLDGRPQREQVGPDKLEVVASFLSHLLVAGCDIGVRFSVRPSVRQSVRPSVRPSVNIYVDVRHLCQS